MNKNINQHLNEAVTSSDVENKIRELIGALEIGNMSTKAFESYDEFTGPDGTIYYPKQIVAKTNQAISSLQKISGVLLDKYIRKMPIMYTFLMRFITIFSCI